MQKQWSLLLALLLLGSPLVGAAADWVQGQNYFPISPAQPSGAPPGKVEVTEIFSFACPACNGFYPVADKLKAALPANVQFDYLPASFRPDEDWPMFQRAFFAAQLMGIEPRTHDAMFDAVWKTGELAVVDAQAQRLKVPAPTIEDAARFYAHAAGVMPEAFLAAARSFGVDVKMRQADQLIMALQVDRTPTIVIDNRYRVTTESAGGFDQLIELVKWLVAQQGAAATQAHPH
jgi:thiol:disulfide interchange protein DsbA